LLCCYHRPSYGAGATAPHRAVATHSTAQHHGAVPAVAGCWGNWEVRNVLSPSGRSGKCGVWEMRRGHSHTARSSRLAHRAPPRVPGIAGALVLVLLGYGHGSPGGCSWQWQCRQCAQRSRQCAVIWPCGMWYVVCSSLGPALVPGSSPIIAGSAAASAANAAKCLVYPMRALPTPQDQEQGVL
jgi:hypothetical protein